jgi:hypothetical protein
VLTENHKKTSVVEASGRKSELNVEQQYLIFLKEAGYALSGARLSDTRTCKDIDILTEKKIRYVVEKRLCLLSWLSEKLTEHDERCCQKWAHENSQWAW